MLQQTQVVTVIPYFKRFIKDFPTLHSLSLGREKKILKLWEGLGYYRRARNLLVTAKIIVKKKFKLPETVEEIKKLPGVGDYTANALLGLVHNKPTIAIDGNVKRIFSRILDKNEKYIDFQKLIVKNKKTLFNSGRNSDFVEAMMEFGALICKPKLPECHKCCIKNMCISFKLKKNFKIKNKKKIISKNYDIFCFLNKRKKQIALSKKNNLGFLKELNLPLVEEASLKKVNKTWKLLSNYSNFISNKKLKINLYYKFSNKIPSSFNWYSLNKNEEFIPTFTKKIFRQISVLF